MVTPIVNPDDVFPSGAGEIWYVPNRAGTAVVRIPAIAVCTAIMDYHRGIDRGWAGYISILLSARTTREPEPPPDTAELEKAVSLALLKPSAL
jgi:hypothetical protein